MNTLEKISKLEAKIGNMEMLVSNLQSIPNSIGNINETVARLAANQTHNVQRTNEIFQSVGDKQDYVVQRIMSIEQAFASLAKTLNAVVAELEENKAINSNSVLRRIRVSDEAAEKARVETMLSVGALKEAEVVSETSSLVVSQAFEPADGKTSEIIADYRVYELTSPLNGKTLIEQFVGKKVGETVVITQPDGTLKTTILAIHEHTQMASGKVDDEGGEVETLKKQSGEV